MSSEFHETLKLTIYNCTPNCKLVRILVLISNIFSLFYSLKNR